MSRLQWNAKGRIFKIKRTSKKSGEDVSISHSIRSSCCFPCNFRGDRSRTRSEIKDVSRGVACEETIPRIRDANTSPMLIAGRKAVHRGPLPSENATGKYPRRKSRTEKHGEPFPIRQSNYEFPIWSRNSPRRTMGENLRTARWIKLVR